MNHIVVGRFTANHVCYFSTESHAIPSAVNKSSALWVVRWLRLVVRCRKMGCGRRLGCFLLARWGLVLGLARVFLRFTIWVVWLDVGDFIDVRGAAAEHVLDFLSSSV